MRRLLSVLSLAVLAVGCGGGDSTPPIKVSSVTVSPSTAAVLVGATTALTATVKDQSGNTLTGRTVTWSSGSTATASVSNDGVVTGVTAGTATITATSEGVSGSATITVNPVPVATVTVAPATATVNVGATTTLAATLKDAAGNTLTGRTTTWSSSPTTIATVTNAGVVTGVAAGSATITATSEGKTGTAAITVSVPALSPTSNTTISGSQTYSSANIPANVTVTITSDAVITVNGDYTQAGTVMAPCHKLTVTATGVLTMTGNVQNDCTDDTDGVDLILIGRGGYSITGSQITSSGDIWIMDGPDLTFASSVRSSPVFRTIPVQPHIAAATNYRCRLVGMTLRATPLTKKKAANGVTKGDDGKSGTSRTSGCGQLLSGQSGGALLVDGVTMIGGTGGEGGDGMSFGATPSVGGLGGQPGALNLVSDGDLDITGSVTLNLGNGGKGGNAISTGAAGSPGVSVTANGGKGSGLKPKNFSSPVTIQSKRGILTIAGTLTINFGTAGAGGDATANGGAGNPGNPGAKGGDATANGGNGGDSEPFSLNTSGSVVVTGQVKVNGGAGGAGGASNRNPGAGGAGNALGAAGGIAGSAFGTGGTGGRGQPANFVANLGANAAAATLQSAGGAAGSSTSSGGKGGDGAANCPNAGGAGGTGGNATGGGGDRGTGTPAGALATVTFNAFGNGGNGKPGNGPGGAGGTNGTSFGSGASGVPPAPGSFLPGAPGGPCPTSAVAVNLASSTPALNPGVVQPGTYTVQLLDAATQAVVGTMNFIAQGGAGNTFYGNNAPSGGPRIGWTTALGMWLADFGSAVVNGSPWTFTTWQTCVLNSAVSATSPVLIEQLDANGNVIATTMVTSLTPCQDITLNPLTKRVRIRGGGGSSADSNGFGGKGGPP